MGNFSTASEKAEHFAQCGKYAIPARFCTLAEVVKVKHGADQEEAAVLRGRDEVVLESSKPQVTDLLGTNARLDGHCSTRTQRSATSSTSSRSRARRPSKKSRRLMPRTSCSEENPLQGVKLRVMAVSIKTRADKDFTKVTFMSESMSAGEAALHARQRGRRRRPKLRRPPQARSFTICGGYRHTKHG